MFVSGESNLKFTMYSKKKAMVLCGKRNPNKLKYKKVQTTKATECWVVKKQHIHKMSITKMQ